MRLIPLLFKHRRYIAPLCLLGGALTLGVASGGCGTYSSSICNTRCDCIKCGTSEREDCYNTLDANLTTTQKLGCEDATDAYYSCRANQGRCVGGSYKEDGCDIEYKAYQRCLFNGGCLELPALNGVSKVSCSPI